jgi:uncharacterized cupredoxin-like copper-binding protein
MKPFTIYALALCWAWIHPSTGTAQTQRFIQWDNTNHQFENIREVDSIASHRFVFRNTHTEPVRLTYVKAGCGCTTPTWTERNVAPGDTGSVIAAYGAWGRPGQFSKQVTVHVTPISNLDEANQPRNPDLRGEFVLNISGNVIPRPLGTDDYYPVVDGSLRLSTNHLNMGAMSDNQTVAQRVTIYNPGPQTVTLESFQGMGNFLKAELEEPNKVRLAPRDSAHVIVTLDAAAANDYDYVYYHIYINTNDAAHPTKTVHVSAQINQDFSHLTAEQRTNAPVMAWNRTIHDFGQIGVLTGAYETTYTLTNNGRSPLVVKKVKSVESALQASINRTTIAPGETATLVVRFHPGEVAATGRAVYNKPVIVVTNDPANPVSRLIVRATLPTAESNNGLPPGHYHGDGHDHSQHGHNH